MNFVHSSYLHQQPPPLRIPNGSAPPSRSLRRLEASVVHHDAIFPYGRALRHYLLLIVDATRNRSPDDGGVLECRRGLPWPAPHPTIRVLPEGSQLKYSRPLRPCSGRPRVGGYPVFVVWGTYK